MLETIRELSRQLSLKNVILEYFVDEDARERLLERAEWSEESSEWNLTPTDLDKLCRSVK